MKLEPITLYMDDNQDRELFEEYMKDNGYVLHPGDYTVNLALVMWGVRIEHSKDCKQEESALFLGEKVILDSKNPEL